MRDAAIKRIRNAVIDAYPGPRWESRVNAMPDKQVIAIYNDLLKGRLINKIYRSRNTYEDNRQFTLEDYGIDLGRRYYSL